MIPGLGTKISHASWHSQKKNACKPSSAVPGAHKCCRDSKFISCPFYAFLVNSDLYTPKPSQSQVGGSHQQPPHLCAHIHVHTHRRKDQVRSNLSRIDQLFLLPQSQCCEKHCFTKSSPCALSPTPSPSSPPKADCSS